MIDRKPTRPGRVKITPEDGKSPFYGTLEMADEPIDSGTPLNKNTLLSDTTANKLDLNGENATVDSALNKLASRQSLGSLRYVEITSSSAWTAPSDAINNQVFVMLFGGGGGGCSYGPGGGGGGGHMDAKWLNITPGQQYFVTIGAGGKAGETVGENGGESSFSSLLTAKGGSGATRENGGDGGTGGGGGKTGHGGNGSYGGGGGSGSEDQCNGGNGGTYGGGGGGQHQSGKGGTYGGNGGCLGTAGGSPSPAKNGTPFLSSFFTIFPYTHFLSSGSAPKGNHEKNNNGGGGFGGVGGLSTYHGGGGGGGFGSYGGKGGVCGGGGGGFGLLGGIGNGTGQHGGGGGGFGLGPSGLGGTPYMSQGVGTSYVSLGLFFPGWGAGGSYDISSSPQTEDWGCGVQGICIIIYFTKDGDVNGLPSA